MICPKITIFLSLQEENSIENISDPSVKVQFPTKSYVEFWVDTRGEFPHMSRKALSIHFLLGTPHLYETWFPAVTAIKTKIPSMTKLGIDLF
jgi:hypothetical protein